MPSTAPDGQPAPADGMLPVAALDELRARATDAVLPGSGFGFYVHVPFCATRCGYCDFNTYTADELGPEPGASRESYPQAACAEVELAARVLGDAAPQVGTVFVGGGTPTLLAPEALGSVLAAIDARFGLEPGAEVTTEANPDSVTPESLVRLREAGFTRVSFGMQSSVRSVLAVLDRTHDPDRVPQAVQWAREAGFEQVSLDLIYGTPGESVADWESSLRSALECRPNHVSAYSLIVEDGTRLARQVRRGEVPEPVDDDAAEKYLIADRLLSEAGLAWYELSNWALDDAARCRHNLSYWRGDHWWGVGPGAHSHIGGVRWWNLKHPAAYAQRLSAGASPAQAREELDEPTRLVERILLETRLREGLPEQLVPASCRPALAEHVAHGLVDGVRLLREQRVTLTPRGRLLADAVVRDLVEI